MNTILLCCTVAWLAAEPRPPETESVAFEWNDSASFQGRDMLGYRTIEFRDTPAQPLTGDFSPEVPVRYGQLPVGPAPETALAVVWQPQAEGGAVLWLDANGDSRLTSEERHTLVDRQIELPALITVQTEPNLQRVQRTLVFRQSVFGAGLRYAVRGYASGSLTFGEARHSVLLVDGNADARLDTVGRDRVWIDLDGDDRFNGLTEQFPLGKPVVAAGQVYVIRSDPLASSVSANCRGLGQGRLRLTLADPREVTQFTAELVSDLGELVVIDKLDEPVAVPHGKYRISGVKIRMPDSQGRDWRYSFARSKLRYHTVTINRETTVLLFHRLAMQVNLERSQATASPGEQITIRPKVTADDDTLYLDSCTTDPEDPLQSVESSAEILLLDSDGRPVSRGLTGFS